MDRLSPSLLAVALLGMAAVIGFIDYLAGTDATFSAIYLFPIGIAAWFLGRPFAYVLAIVCPLLMGGGDIAAGVQFPSELIHLWNFGVRFTVFAVALNLIVELRALHNTLGQRAAERAAELTAEIAKRQNLERELLHISEREQRRLGHDIHDSLCQHLTGTALAAGALTESLRTQDSEHAKRARRVVELIEEGISLSRNLAKGLNTIGVSTGGLMEALEEFASGTSDLFGISCRFECPLPVPIEDPDVAMHLFRIAQEAVGNAVKHGHAKNVRIRLETTEEGNCLRVIDDGVGMPEKRNGKGMGLRIMSYRADIIGARFDIARNESSGMTVSCVIPSRQTQSSVVRRMPYIPSSQLQHA